MKITRDDAIKELERELKMRERVYPRFVQSGKLHRDTAERQYRRLQAAINFLKEDTPSPTSNQKRLF